MTFVEKANAALKEALTKFGEHQFYDKGACEVMDIDSLANDLRVMHADDAVAQLKALAACDDAAALLAQSIAEELGDWSELDAYPDFAEIIDG